MQPNIDSRDGIYVARQPIFDAAGQVFGYELLYRAAADHTSCEESADLAAARVVTDAVLTVGLETLTGGRLAFINLTRRMLVAGFGTLLPPRAVVIELLENTEVDEEVIEACRRLRALGYSLALDNFTLESGAQVLLPFARFVKVDVLATSSEQRRAIQKALPSTISLVAERVETAEMSDEARATGYRLFQGYYFCRPKTFAAGPMSTRRLVYARLLASLNQPNVRLNDVEDLIKLDASLSFRILRCINSAAFGISREIHSIREALVLLGLDRVRKWASVWALAGLNSGGGSSELVTTAILRARCCELLAEASVDSASEYFLLGLCSLMDTMLGQPMAAAVAELPLPHHLRNALVGEKNIARSILDAVIAYERGFWEEAAESSRALGASVETLPAAYADALRWARGVSQLARAA